MGILPARDITTTKPGPSHVSGSGNESPHGKHYGFKRISHDVGGQGMDTDRSTPTDSTNIRRVGDMRWGPDFSAT